VSLEVGAHVIIAVPHVDARLSALSTAVWYIAPDGSLSGSDYLMAANAEDLRTKLRDAVPDSALQAIGRPNWSLLGTVLLVLGCLFAVGRLGPRRTRAAPNR
jgi:hypothetical protein